MSNKTSPRETASPVAAAITGNSVDAPWSTDVWMAPWMSLGMQVWSSWLNLWGVGETSRPGGGERRAELPWLPQIESTVVPLRRRDDEPGAEAAKLSMRIHVPPLPWEAGPGSVIAINSLRPRVMDPAKTSPPIRH